MDWRLQKTPHPFENLTTIVKIYRQFKNRRESNVPKFNRFSKFNSMHWHTWGNSSVYAFFFIFFSFNFSLDVAFWLNDRVHPASDHWYALQNHYARFNVGFSVIQSYFQQIQTDWQTQILAHKNSRPACDHHETSRKSQETGNWRCLISFELSTMWFSVHARYGFVSKKFVCLFVLVLSLQIRSKCFFVSVFVVFASTHRNRDAIQTLLFATLLMAVWCLHTFWSICSLKFAYEEAK